MYVYAGIDEAGYGPLVGPLLVGRAVIGIPRLPAGPRTPCPQMWQRLSKCVCRSPGDRRKRIAINDSKKLKTQAAGIRHLERGVLAFAALAGHSPQHVGQWLAALGDTAHHRLDHLPWYAPRDARPWDPVPAACTTGEIAVAAGQLKATAKRIGVQMLDLGAAVVFEDRFNHMVRMTRSKASANFTFVGAHLQSIYRRFGNHHPVVVVDRQSGRTFYREPLAQIFPDARMTVVEESPAASTYRLESHSIPPRAMDVTFVVDAEQRHLPVALASMISKYTRELMMARLNAFFTAYAPEVAPTAGYFKDGRRFMTEIAPVLEKLAIAPDRLARVC